MDPAPHDPTPITITLTDEEATRLATLLRLAIRKTVRNRRTSATRHGTAFDPTDIDRRLASYRDIYLALGRNPDWISNVDWPAAHTPPDADPRPVDLITQASRTSQ